MLCIEVLLAWTNKSNPVSMPVAIFFETTNWLFYFEPPMTPLSKLAPILRIVMPAQCAKSDAHLRISQHRQNTWS